MKVVYITGCLGFIGFHVTQACLTQGWYVIGVDKKTYAEDLIKPKLNNWDADRIAVLDMILLRLGVCELLYFETIPTKVTINEYIDIAKEYSTEQSGQFVNGILDNIHKELVAAGKIQKSSHLPKEAKK